jgi:hypothetical protein
MFTKRFLRPLVQASTNKNRKAQEQFKLSNPKSETYYWETYMPNYSHFLQDQLVHESKPPDTCVQQGYGPAVEDSS